MENLEYTPLVTALIAGAVSLIVSVISALVSTSIARKSLRHETERLERGLQRGKTDKLYELRLSCYPSAFKLTEPLLGTKLFKDKISTEEVKSVLKELNEWKANEATFVMSKASHDSFYHIRWLLNKMAEEKSPYSDQRISELFEAKNSFRKSLQNDVGLLFEEDTL